MDKVKIELPTSCLIGDEVVFKGKVLIRPNTIITGKCEIGDNTVLGPNSEIINTIVGNNSIIQHSLVIDSKIGDNVSVGPFAHLRNSKQLVLFRIWHSVINNNTKISHLSYVGDAEIGKNVNIGAGVITANYDGKNKNKTIIKDKVFIGSNSTLIAPITIEEESLVAAGSTLTNDVPSSSLAIARSYQVNKKRVPKNSK